MKIGKISFLIAVAIMQIVGSASEVTASTKKKKVLTAGVVFRFDDKFNTTVTQMTTGLEIAKKLYESKHPGITIVLRRYSHGEDLESVANAAQRVVDDKLSAVIGGEMSEESFVLGDKFADKKVVFVTPTSSNPKVTEGKPFTFRTCFSDKKVAQQLSAFVFTKLKPKAVGVIHNVSSPYTDYLSKQFIETYDQLAQKNPDVIKVKLVEEKVLRDTPDFEKQIDSFKRSGVTHVAMLTHQNDLIKFALQAGAKGFNPIYIGSDGWGSNESILKNLVTESPHGVHFVGYRNNYWKEDSRTKAAGEFRRLYQLEFKQSPTAWSAIAFDTGWLVFTALDRAKDARSGSSVRDALVKIQKMPLVTADRFTFGEDNSPEKDLYIYRIGKDGVKYEATLR